MRPPPHATPPRIEWPTIELASIDLCRWYFPGRGLGFSFFIHGIVLFLLIQVFPSLDRPEEVIPPWEVEGPGGGGELLIYLPNIGGGGPGGGGGKGSSAGGSSSAAAAGRRAAGAGVPKDGLVYPGPQLIRSDPEKPTNRFQTVLQPDLEDQPIVSPPLKLPNLVSLADAAPQPPKAPPRKLGPDDMIIPTAKPKPKLEISTDPAEAEAARAKLENLPVADTQDAADLLAAAQVPVLPAPVIAEPAVGLADPDEPEPQESRMPRKGAVVPPRRQPEDLPIESRDMPTAPQATDVKLAPQSTAAESRPPEAEAVQPPADPREYDEEAGDRALVGPLNVKPLEASKLVAANKSPSLGSNARNVAALSPVPVWSGEPVVIPAGEARGRFTVSPHSNLDSSETEPGSGLPGARPGGESMEPGGGGLPSSVTIGFGPGGGTGSGTGAGSGIGAGSGSGSGTGGGTGGGTGTGSGSGSGPGSGPGGGSGSGSGPGTGAGSGAGSGPFEGISIIGGVDGAQAAGGGPGIGSGTGGGTGPGAGALPGITIGPSGGSGAAGPARPPLAGITTVGGVDAEPAEPVPDQRVGRPLRNRYELFVLSSEKSGGGLPYFGVFSDEQIQTVYLDMRQEETEDAPLWTLEFAVPPESTTVAGGDDRQGFVLPVPSFKERPEWPRELVSRHAGKLVVVYGVVNPSGKMESVSVLESPDPELNRPLIQAMVRWVFRPGTLHGNPVPVKALLGIPLWSSKPPK